MKYMISWFERPQGSPMEYEMPRSGYWRFLRERKGMPRNLLS